MLQAGCTADLELSQQRVLIYQESGGAAGGGPLALLPVLFHAEFWPRFLPLPFTCDFFFCFKQEHTCCPLYWHSFRKEEVRALLPYSIELPCHRAPSGDLIQNPPDLTFAFLSIAKSSEFRSGERLGILACAFVSYSSVCSEGERGRD